MSDYETLRSVLEKSSWLKCDFLDNVEFPLKEDNIVKGKSIWMWDDIVGDCVEILFDKNGNII